MSNIGDYRNVCIQYTTMWYSNGHVVNTIKIIILSELSITLILYCLGHGNEFMRDYSKAAPTFWTGETGRRMRGRCDLQVVAFYLFSCPNSNWIGLYYLPLPTLCHEVGISREGALKALRSLEEIDFAYYDIENEVVWVPGAARYQVGESLKPGDNKIIGIVKDLQQYAKSPYARDFYRRYAGLYHLPQMEWPKPSGDQNGRPSEGALEGLPIGVGDRVGDGMHIPG